VKSDLSVTVLDYIPEDPEIVLAWNHLVLEMEKPEVFHTQQWSLAVSISFSHQLRVLTFLVNESSQLVGVAAMAASRESPKKLFFLTETTADYCDVVSNRERRGDVLDCLLEKFNQMDVIEVVLANLPSNSQSLSAIRDRAKAHRFYLNERPAYDCGIISLGNEEQRLAIRHSVMRKEREKRSLKKLTQIGSVRLVHLMPEQVDSSLEPIFSAQVSRFLSTNRQSPLIDPQRRLFLRELARLLGTMGWLKVSAMTVNGLPIAWNYGFRFLDSWFWYLPAFQMQFEEFSPGSTLLRLITEEACGDMTLARLDLGLGDEPYKTRFRNATISTRYLQLSKSMPTHLANAARYRLASFARAFPQVDARIRNGRRSFRSLRNRLSYTGLRPLTNHLSRRVERMLKSQEEIVFFEAAASQLSGGPSFKLGSLSYEDLARTALDDPEDNQTLAYLLRSAERLKEGHAQGYCLSAEDGQVCHFLWVTPCNGFHLSEINFELESSMTEGMMIFDCWTPSSQRGRGHYPAAIRLAAAHILDQKERAWIFCEIENKPSLSGIVKSGFVYRFSLQRNRILWHASVSRREEAVSKFRTPTSQ
jgi:hypothetical protein